MWVAFVVFFFFSLSLFPITSQKSKPTSSLSKTSSLFSPLFPFYSLFFEEESSLYDLIYLVTFVVDVEHIINCEVLVYSDIL